MKIRIAASIALAAGLVLGASGCSLIAPQGTLEPYAPSDGVEVTTEGVALRNILLIADEEGKNFNVVFTSVNTNNDPATAVMRFDEGSSSAEANFSLPVGTTVFGDPEADSSDTLQLVSLPGVDAGSTVKTYIKINGENEIEHNIPVLDGTLKEYEHYVIGDLPGTTESDLDEDAERPEGTSSEIE